MADDPQRCIIHIHGGPSLTPGVLHGLPPLVPPMAMAMQVSLAEQEHMAMLRARSYQLAVARGHVRR